jgi:hypothetical protein
VNAIFNNLRENEVSSSSVSRLRVAVLVLVADEKDSSPPIVSSDRVNRSAMNRSGGQDDAWDGLYEISARITV